jgi:hypothetical protein
VIEQALELYLKEKDPNDIKEAFRVYNQKHWLCKCKVNLSAIVANLGISQDEAIPKSC